MKLPTPQPMPSAQFKPVYVLYGNDGYLRDEHRRAIVEEVVGPADAQLAVVNFEGNSELAEVLDSLRTPPLMTPCRLVILHNADDFLSADPEQPESPDRNPGPKKAPPHRTNRQAMEEYLQKPCPTAALLLLVKSWPSTTNLAKQVAKIGRAIECAAPAGNLPRWIADAARKRGKQIEPAAAQILEQYVGADLAALDAEIEKLSLYVGERPAIAASDVGVLTVASAGPEDFALGNALAAGDANAALTVLEKTLTRRGLEFMVLGQIGWILRIATHAQTLRRAGRDPSAALKVPYKMRPAFLALLQRRPLAELQADFRRVLAADLAMKSGAEPRAAMQDLVLSLCL